MAIIGGEVEQLSALKASFEKHAGIVQELTSSLRAQLEATHWQGPTSERFRSVWTGEYEPVLRKLEMALIEAGHAVGLAKDRLVEAGS